MPSLPSISKESNVDEQISNAWRSDLDAHFLPERVCESCLVPSLPSKIKEINAGG